MKKKIISFIVLSLIILLYILSKKESAEDKFHKNIHKNVNKIDDSPIVKLIFNDNKDYNFIYNNIVYNDVFKQHDIKFSKLNPSFNLIKKDILNGSSPYLNFKFYRNENKITWNFNHYYLGGHSFLTLKYLISFQKELIIPKSSLLYCYLIPKLIIDYYQFIKSKDFKSLPRSNEINPYRYYEDRIFSFSETESFPKRNFVIFKVLQQVYQSLLLDRPMRVLIPVPFQRFNKINNNVGAIFLIFNKNDTLKTFSENFEKNKYKALATNSVLISNINSLFSNNETLRNKIDVIITSIYSKQQDDMVKKLNYSLYWSPIVKPTEPIYVAVYSRILDDKINTNITYTVSSSQFKKSDNMKIYNLN